MIIDTHCHIYKSETENAEEIIKKAAKNDIHIILNGTSPSTNTEVLELASVYDNVHAALGYFHTFADEVSDEDINVLDSQLEEESVVAIGEIGLDYYHGKDNSENQKKLFEKMLELAQKHNLPAIIHSRKSHQDIYNILKKYNVSGSMHSYNGSPEMAEQFIKSGFLIGVSGTVTHPKNRKTKKLISTIGISNMVVETDSPYMTPEECRGEKNTPLNLKFIIAKIAEILDTDEREVEKITADNAKKLFAI